MTVEKSSLRDKIARAQAALAGGELATYEPTRTLDDASSKTAASWGPAMRV